MSLRIILALALLTGVTGSPLEMMKPEPDSVDTTVHPNSVPETVEETEIFGQLEVLEEEEPEEEMMETGELNPNYYAANRAAKVVEHDLNTRYGSPYRRFLLDKVYSGNAEDVANSGRKYQLKISVKELVSNTTGNCSAEVLFPRGEQQRPPKVQASCEELLKLDTKAQEEALYQQCKTNQSLLSTPHLPDSHGHIDPDMEPFWHLGHAASSFVMLNESTENTLYGMAQVANITQLETENDQLKFDCHTLLHDMVSQEIIHWKLLFTWSPPEGVKVLQMKLLPRCGGCGKTTIECVC